jgi:hypothetical protein
MEGRGSMVGLWGDGVGREPEGRCWMMEILIHK